MSDYANPYDPENAIDRPKERRDMTEAGSLRRAAFKFEQRGNTLAATLLKNTAFILENPLCQLDRFDTEEYKRIPRETGQ